MKPRQYSSEGILIAKRSHSEADKIFVILAKKYGKIRLLAKGVKKLKSRKRGHLEVFSQVRFSAVNLPGMDLVTEVELINDFPTVRSNLSKMTLGFYFCEVVNKITREGEKHDDIYQLMLEHFNELENTKRLKLLRLKFIFNLLVLLGYWSQDKKMIEADQVLEQVIERRINSFQIGKKILL